MSFMSKFYVPAAIVVTILGELIVLGCIAVASAQGAEIAAEPKILPPAVGPEERPLNLVTVAPLVAQGATLGAVVIYDDPATPRPADYLEVYNRDGSLVAVAWFDRFGIERVAVDRAFVEGEDQLEGVFVAVVDGNFI